MQVFLGALLQDVISSVVFAALVSASAFLYLKLGWRRLFRVADPKKVVVVVAASAHTETGTYKRASTGVGQVRAIADLAPRFAQAYWRQRLDHVFTSDAELHERVEGDIVALGGEKTNALTYELLEAWSTEEGFPVQPTNQSTISWRGREHASAGDGSRLTVDYGLIVRGPNPIATDPRHVAIVIAGASTAGGHAASRRFTTDRWFRRHRYVAALVECRVRDGFPVQVRVLEKMVRDKGAARWRSERPEGEASGIRRDRVVPGLEVRG